MKKFILVLLLICAALEVQAQSRQKCSLCRGTGSYSRQGGYGVTQQHFDICPSCNKNVDLFNHHCRCGWCNGTGYYSGGSSSNYRPNPSRPSGVDTGDTPDIVKQAVIVDRCLKTNTIPTWETCRTCNGTGVCTVCKGSGITYSPYLGAMPCMPCSGLKRCGTCLGGKMFGYSRTMTADERRRYEEWMKWYIYKGY